MFTKFVTPSRPQRTPGLILDSNIPGKADEAIVIVVDEVNYAQRLLLLGLGASLKKLSNPRKL